MCPEVEGATWALSVLSWLLLVYAVAYKNNQTATASSLVNWAGSQGKELVDLLPEDVLQ